MTFEQVKQILQDPRTVPLGDGRFSIEGVVYEIDELDLQVYRDEAIRNISQCLGFCNHRSVWRTLWEVVTR